MTNSGRPSFAGIRECKLNRRPKLRRRPRSPSLKYSPVSPAAQFSTVSIVFYYAKTSENRVIPHTRNQAVYSGSDLDLTTADHSNRRRRVKVHWLSCVFSDVFLRSLISRSPLWLYFA